MLIVGLGCEANQISALLGAQALTEGPLLHTFIIQDTGGTAKTIAHGIGMIDEMLPQRQRRDARAGAGVAHHRRPAVRRLRRLLGHHARIPALGAAVDLLVRHGGTAILSETPEIYGAEHLLTRRAVSRDVGEKLIVAHPLVGGLHDARRRAR